MDILTRFVRERRVDAMIAVNQETTDCTEERMKSVASLPVVLIDRPVSGANIRSVIIDNVDGAFKAVNHLLQAHACRDFLIISGPEGSFDCEQRLKGAVQALEAAGDGFSHRVMLGDFTAASGFWCMEQYVAGNDQLPSAIFALNDAMALGAMEYCMEAGIQIPEDLRVMGFDDIMASRLAGLATVNVDYAQMGAMAVDMALDQEMSLSRQLIVKAELVPRRSCGCRARNSYLNSKSKYQQDNRGL